MTQMSMVEWCARAADRLEQAGFDKSETAIVISDPQEMDLKKELFALTNIWVQSLHHAEFHGWRIIVRGGN